MLISMDSHLHHHEAGQEAAPSGASKETQELKDYQTTVTILESITDAIFILNAMGRIEYANRSALDYLQLPLEEVIKNELMKFISSENPETLQLLHHGLRHGQLASGNDHEIFSNSEAELHGARGTIPVLINFSIVPESNGSLKYIIVTAKEITYRKSLEKELKHRQALSVSFDRLKALGEMSVGLVHTLGQPVTSMELRLEHLSHLDDISEIKKQVAILQQDMSVLGKIVTKVRSYAQLMDAKQTQAVAINDNLNGILQILEYDIRSANVDVNLSLENNLPTIDANEPELEQVFINLVANTIQAFDTNNIQEPRLLEISTCAKENKWIQVSFKDNAGGISESVLPKIFEPFYSTWDKDKHAGTGLSVARSIVTSLGGDLNAEVNEDCSTFKLRIPISQTEERTQLFNLIELLNS